MKIQIVLGILAIISIVTTWYCIETAQTVDENYNPLELEKTLKDVWNKLVNKWENLNDHLALSFLILLFFSLVWLVNRVLFNI
jgi:hypothetical protein